MKVGVILAATAIASSLYGVEAQSAPVPGYVPPVNYQTVPDYADDTRGVFVPSHGQHRLKTEMELAQYNAPSYEMPTYVGGAGMTGETEDAYERELNRISAGHLSNTAGLDMVGRQVNRIEPAAGGYGQQPYGAGQMYPVNNQQAPGGAMYAQQAMPQTAPHVGAQRNPYSYNPPAVAMDVTAGAEIARGEVYKQSLDMTNALVRLREDRITIRRALQRMMDQIGGGDWTVVWDLAEQNAGLPEMEISIYSEEPFMSVLNALLARVQSRSGQPLRVVRYDNTQRLVITDQAGGSNIAGKSTPAGVDSDEGLAVTEQVLKEAMVSLHYDEIPLVDALENVVSQAGRGQWRLRMYAGLDQVLKPAHIEEPFGTAMERLLKLFNLKYEIFPGGKLIVVTHNDRFGYGSVK